MINREHVENVLKEKMSIHHKDGYVATIEDNLIPGITNDLFLEDLSKGKGKELDSKFLSIASSAALAVNNFALIKKNKESFTFGNKSNFINAGFEKEFSTDLKGVNPQLDFYLENEKNLIGFESKFLEYYTQTTADFSKSYNNLSYLDEIWFKLIEKYQGKKMFLDVAQLMKHSFGIINQSIKANKKGSLVFIYWLPVNYKNIDTCTSFLDQIQEFANDLKQQTQIDFEAISYLDFWEMYKNDDYLSKNIEYMIDKYGNISI
jgi:hypothetical protein